MVPRGVHTQEDKRKKLVCLLFMFTHVSVILQSSVEGGIRCKRMLQENGSIRDKNYRSILP